jgi:predicted nucleic acid-binding protein
MSIRINSNIIDALSDVPKTSDKFWVDSNVWLWVTYPQTRFSGGYNQAVDYPAYLNKALLNSAALFASPLSFAELAHIIEREEWESFQTTQGVVSKKNFRHNFPVERQRIVQHIENAWGLVEAMTGGNSIDLSVNMAAIASARNRMKTQALDGYDLFMVDALLASRIQQVITDDGDFAQVPGVTIFTNFRQNAPNFSWGMNGVDGFRNTWQRTALVVK